VRFSYEGDWDKAWSFFDEAQHELFRLKERMTALGIAQGSFHAAMGNGEAYVFGYVLPTGLEAVHIITEPGRGPVSSVDFVDPRVPDFLSGYLVNGRFVDVDGEERVADFRAGLSCQRLHPEEVGEGRNRVRRLAIKPGDIAGISEGADIAQAALIRPTMYSGTMRKVVQFLLGLGKQFSNESIYDAAEPPLPDEMVEAAEEDSAALEDETAYESLVKSQGVRLLYDHRFQRTHGVVRAPDQRWWLVEISSGRGIIAMPLPLIRYTDSPEFREKCENLGDNEALQVLDLFGGFPSGESFPTDARAIESAVRSGRILRLRTSDQVKSFYELNAYSSIMGWAFSESGGEAHNTGYRIDDMGYVLGSHFAAQMSIGSFIEVDADDEAESLKSALGAAIGDKPRQVFDEVMWKIDRMTGEQIDEYLEDLNTKTPSEVFDLVDAATLQPSASHGVSFTRTSEGYLYSRAIYGPQIKFPEPILGGCVSAPLYQSNASLPAVNCDTTVHVFFAGEELKWAKYYYQVRTAREYVAADTYTGREDIPVGDFVYERHSGLYGVAPGFYTNNFDDRIERGETIYSVRYKRRFSGFYETLTRSLGTGDRASDYTDRDFDPPVPGGASTPTVYRMAKFAYEEWRSSRNSHAQCSAIVVPMEDRCSYYYTIEQGNAGGLDQYMFGYERIGDPNVGYYNNGTDDHKIQGTSRTFSVGSQLWPNHQERIDLADRGEWVTVGVDVRTIVTNYFINLNDYSRSTSTIEPPRFTMECRFVSESQHTPVLVFSRSKVGSDFYPHRWFMPSPDPESGFVDVINSTHNCLGEATSLVYSTDLNTSDRELKGTPGDSVLRAVIPTFIGPFDA